MIKFIQLAATQFLAGTPIPSSSDPAIAVDKLGIPRQLGPLKNLLLDGNLNSKRLFYTLMSVKRILSVKTEPDITPITMAPSAISEKLIGEMAAGVTELGLDLDLSSWEDPHLSTKVGPNGLATISALTDLDLIPKELEQNL